MPENLPDCPEIGNTAVDISVSGRYHIPVCRIFLTDPVERKPGIPEDAGRRKERRIEKSGSRMEKHAAGRGIGAGRRLLRSRNN